MQQIFVILRQVGGSHGFNIVLVCHSERSILSSPAASAEGGNRGSHEYFETLNVIPTEVGIHAACLRFCSNLIKDLKSK